MTAEQVSATADVITAIVGAILLWQLILAKHQLAEARKQNSATAKWNQLSSAYGLISPTELAASEHALDDKLRALNIPLITPDAGPLTTAHVDAVWKAPDAYRALRAHLNLVEEYAIAVRSGSIDKDLAYSLRSYAIKRATYFFREFIDRARAHFGDPTIYLEMDLLDAEWQPHRDKEKADYSAAQSKAVGKAAVRQQYP